MHCILETIAFTIDSCRMAQSAGAHRIELCDNPGEGGTTPSFGFIRSARRILQIPLYVMIRPRGGDFLYSADEFEIMKADIKWCKQTGCDGIVLGLLHTDGSIDKKRTTQLAELAYPMGVTFHRAFDRCANPFEALEHIIDSGCERILTSGQQPTAMEGATLIADLVKQADERIIIMPGSGVRSDTVMELAQKTGAREFHTSAKAIKKTEMKFLISSMNEQLQSVAVDDNEVKSILEKLSKVNSL